MFYMIIFCDISACNCDTEGSGNTQCDLRTGQCVCKSSIEGEKCDRCVENKFNITAGCIGEYIDGKLY